MPLHFTVVPAVPVAAGEGVEVDASVTGAGVGTTKFEIFPLKKSQITRVGRADPVRDQGSVGGGTALNKTHPDSLRCHIITTRSQSLEICPGTGGIDRGWTSSSYWLV